MNFTDFEYGRWLPFTAKLPLSLGACLSFSRGILNANFDRDWRSIALGNAFVRSKTKRALWEIQSSSSSICFCKSFNNFEKHSSLYERFVYAAYEEWQGNLIIENRLSEMSFKGEEYHQLMPDQAIIATIHYDSPMLGLVKLGDWGRPICALSSNIIQDPRVPVTIKSYFHNKYKAMADHWHGGQCMSKEDQMRHFVSASKRGYSLAVFCDVPGSRIAIEQNETSNISDREEDVRSETVGQVTKGEKGIWVDFLGRRRLVAPVIPKLMGLLKLPIVGMICKRIKYNMYVIEFSTVFNADDPDLATQHLYDFFSEKIFDKPGSWWASDLLADYPVTDMA